MNDWFLGLDGRNNQYEEGDKEKIQLFVILQGLYRLIRIKSISKSKFRQSCLYFRR